MADIELGTIATYWKSIYDWILGNITNKPKISVPDIETKLDMILNQIQNQSVTLNGRKVQSEFTFQNAATSVNDGTANKLTLNGANRVIVGIGRTAITANTISFKATGPAGVVGSILGYKINSDGSITTASNSSATTDEVWMFDDLAGYTDIFFSIDSITGTSITVIGKAVA